MSPNEPDGELTAAARTALAANRAEGGVDHRIYDRFFSGRRGVFLDIGAARPDFLSMSAAYRLKGWRVVAIEPNPAYAPRYAELGLTALPFAISGSDGDDVEFSVVDSRGAQYHGGNLSYESFSSLGIKDSYDTSGHDLAFTKIRVQTRRLDTIFRDYYPDVTKIDLVSIDIEGWELEALATLDFGRFSPDVLIVENLQFDAAYHRFMAARGYLLWRCVAPNDVYVRADLVPSAGARLAARLQAGAATAAGRLRRRAGRLRRRLQA